MCLIRGVTTGNIMHVIWIYVINAPGNENLDLTNGYIVDTWGSYIKDGFVYVPTDYNIETKEIIYTSYEFDEQNTNE